MVKPDAEATLTYLKIMRTFSQHINGGVLLSLSYKHPGITHTLLAFRNASEECRDIHKLYDSIT